ncbi:MAG: flagellar hook protein [Denitrovibrio sp.]|nr:MAG: flagellar hook protein [Denitrovibrio sp.]
MAGIQVGGIVSGMDTNGIVEKMLVQAKVPVDRLYGDYEYKKFENEVYTDYNEKLSSLSSDLLNLRLESTFKTKLTSTTNNSIVTATATTDAAVGNHSIQVDQIAKNSLATSAFTRFSLSSEGANITKVSGLSSDYLEGVHEVTIAASGSDFISTTEMKVDNIGTISKSTGDAIDGASVSASGTLAIDFTGSFSINYVDSNDNNQTLTVTDTFGSTGEDINDVAARLEFELNEGMNSSMGTTAKQYISMRAEYDAGTWNMAMYETTVEDYSISVGGTDAGSLRDEIGFAEAYTPTTSSTTSIMKYHVADSLANLDNKIFSAISGVVGGATFELSTTSLAEGSFTIAQDASLKVSSDTYTTYTGTTASTGSGLDTTVEGLDAAGFDEVVNTDANGYFTINSVKITIEDYTKISVNDMLGIINSAGACVTASYDSTNDQFLLKSNYPGSTKISLGAYGDTSNVIELMKLDYASNPTLDTGSSSDSIDASDNLVDSGLTVYPFTGTFTINGVSIYVDTSTESLNDVISKVNKSGAGVTMAYDTVSDKVTLRSDNIDDITVGSANDTSNLLEALNLTSNTEVATTIGESGQRAILTVDGTTYVRESNAVSDIINGVTLSLNGISTSTASINVEVDTEKAVVAFSKFIAHYNEVMMALDIPEKEDTEDEYIAHLSDAEKEGMGEADLEAYLEKYEMYNKYDIVRRSSELRNLDTIMRKTFFAERPGITGSINDMSDLGIKVAGAGDLDTEFKGYLVEFSTDYEEIASELRDNSNFMDAITENPDDVFNFFANYPEEPEEGSANYTNDYNSYLNELGWSRYFNDVLVDRYTGDDGMIGNKLGLNGSISNDLLRLEDRIIAQEDRVENQLERYWKQFTAMEMAIADAQSQSADFSQAGG